MNYKIGTKVVIDEENWLPVRYVDSTSLFEDPKTGEITIENELYIELRNVEGEVKFVTLETTKNPGRRDPGPIKGIKPYFWKVQSDKIQTVGR